MIGRVGLNKPGMLAGSCPVELTGIDDDTSDGCSVTSDELRGGVDYDIGTVLDGSYKIRSRESIVYDKGYAVLVGNLGDSFDIDYFRVGIAERLDMNCLCILPESGLYCIKIQRIYESRCYAVSGKCMS